MDVSFYGILNSIFNAIDNNELISYYKMFLAARVLVCRILMNGWKMMLLKIL